MNTIPLPAEDGQYQELEENRENIALPRIDEVTGKEDDKDERAENEKDKSEFSFKVISEDDIIESYKKSKKDLEIRASKKFLSSRHAKSPFNKSRFTSTWVQYEESGGEGMQYDPSTQNPFVRIIFIIVFAMLIITAVFTFYCEYNWGLKQYFSSTANLVLVIPAAIILFSLNFVMICVERTRSSPFIYIFLVISLIATCVVTGYIGSQFKVHIISLIYLMWGSCVIFFIYLTFVNFDFTHWFLHIIGLSVVAPFVIGFSAFAYDRAFYLKNCEHWKAVLGTFTVIMSSYILFMTIMLQILLSGKVVELGETDYALGAFYLYTSYFDIFLKMCQLLPRLCACVQGESDSED